VALFMNFVTRRFPDLPSLVSYVPDAVIAIAALFVVAGLIGTRNWTRIPLKYLLVFAMFCYVVMMGLLLNGVSGDTAFAGIRTYFKYVPVFLIPFAFSFSDASIRNHLIVLVLVMFAQVPVTIWQRFVEFRSLATGDFISGTLTSTSSIAILAVFAILTTLVFYIDKRIRLSAAFVLAILFLLPAAIAETKVTPVLLALGGAAVLLVRWRQLGTRLIMQSVVVGSVLLGVFMLVHNALYSDRFGRTYVQQMTDSSVILDSYNLTGVRAKPFKVIREGRYDIVGHTSALESGEERLVGRFDSIRLPVIALLPEEQLRLLVGLGIGNVSTTFGSGGDYLNVKNELGGTSTTLAMLIWETGMLGTLLFVTFLVFVTLDARRLASSEGLSGSLGAAMVGVGLAVIVCLAYANLFHLHEVLILFSYFGGLVVSRLAWQRVAVVDEVRHSGLVLNRG
jgi:hypothetical protein